ncbi:MAG: hypothetical protein JXR37_20840 [Kiritimatiellae bacterium]|nr:hypothetical protein [Kiritimatiellia bacterium]
MHIIDCHWHPAFDAATDCSWFQPVGDIPAQIDALRRAGISRACGATFTRGRPASFAPVTALNDKALALRDRFPDFSGAGIDRYGLLRKGIDVAGVQKLLFGVDYPINNPASYVAGALFEQLSDEENAALFSGNFLRLTRLAGKEE